MRIFSLSESTKLIFVSGILLLNLFQSGLLFSQETVRDEFSSQNYSNNDGTQNWSTNWIEMSDDDSPTGGKIRIDNNERLRFNQLEYYWPQIKRSADLSGAESATLSFDWRTVSLTGNRQLDVEISSTGSDPYTSIGTFTGTVTGHFTSDISAYISPTTTIRFVNRTDNKWEDDDYVRVDNVEISYIKNPTLDPCVNGPDNIWTEDFEGVNQGWTVSSGKITKRTYPANGSGGNGMVGNNLGSSAEWITNNISISNYTNLKCFVDIGSWGDQMEDEDYLRVYYDVDGSGYTEFSVNGNNRNDIGEITSCTNIPNGNLLKIRVVMRNTWTDEYYYLDNVTVSGTLLVPDSPPVITASGNQSFCAGSAPLHVVTTISISDPDPGDTQLEAMSVQISEGYISSEDVLSLSGSFAGITSSWDVVAGRLTLTGPATFAQFESAISNVQYTNTNFTPTTGARKFSITLQQANYLPETDHFYEFVSDVGIRWDDARDAAALKTYYGLQGYLATLTSKEESDLAGSQISGAGWIGASDAAAEGVWKWVTGPETGTVFWNGGIGGSSPNWAFWNSGEPNQAGDEDYAHITDPTVGIDGSWNDLSITGATNGVYQPKGYVVEYGGTPGDPILQISASTIIIVNTQPIPLGIYHE